MPSRAVPAPELADLAAGDGTGTRSLSLVLQEAERCGIHRTVHAGEAGPAAMVKEVRGVPESGQRGTQGYGVPCTRERGIHILSISIAK